MSICANITSRVENIVVCHKVLPTYRQGDVLYICFKAGSTDMVCKGEGGAIGVQVCVTNAVANLL